MIYLVCLPGSWEVMFKIWNFLKIARSLLCVNLFHHVWVHSNKIERLTKWQGGWGSESAWPPRMVRELQIGFHRMARNEKIVPTRCNQINNLDTREGVGVLGGEYIGVPGGVASLLHREKATELCIRILPTWPYASHPLAGSKLYPLKSIRKMNQ